MSKPKNLPVSEMFYKVINGKLMAYTFITEKCNKFSALSNKPPCSAMCVSLSVSSVSGVNEVAGRPGLEDID